MAMPHTYRKESADFAHQAPVHFVMQRELPCSGRALFKVFEDADAWTKWAGLKSVKWTSPPPFNSASTRTVSVGPLTADEQFTEWQDGKRMSFYFAAGSTRLIRAFAEDYVVEAQGDDRCLLTWYMGFELAGPAKLLGPVVGFAMKRQFTAALERLAGFVESD